MTLTAEQEQSLLGRVADLEAYADVTRRYFNGMHANGLDPMTTDGGMVLSNHLVRALADNIIQGYSGNQITLLGELDTRSVDIINWVFGELMSNLLGAYGRVTVCFNGNYPEITIHLQDAAGTVIAETTWNPTTGATFTNTNGSTSSTVVIGPSGITGGGSLIESGYFELSGVVSPSQIVANQNDYDPGGWLNIPPTSKNSWFRLTSDASRNITGWGGPPPGFEQGFVFLIHNVGSFNIVLKDESGLSTAKYRFALTGDITLVPDSVALLQYDNTTQRWRCVGTTGTSGVTGVATDPIWDVKGDLAVGTGADTAQRLPAPENRKRLQVDSTQTTGLVWDADFGTVKTKSGNYTMVARDRFIVCNGSTDFTITLLSTATLTGGDAIMVKHLGTAGTVTVDASGSETIDGQLTIPLAVGDCALLITDATSWYVS